MNLKIPSTHPPTQHSSRTSDHTNLQRPIFVSPTITFPRTNLGHWINPRNVVIEVNHQSRMMSITERNDAEALGNLITTIDYLQTPRLSYKIILILQAQALMIPPPLVWKFGMVHTSNPFNLLLMKILIWNCKGTKNPYSHKSFTDLINSHLLEIVIIMETHIFSQRVENISSY